MAVKQIPLTCPGHTRPVVDLAFSEVTDHGYYLISACKGQTSSNHSIYNLSYTALRVYTNSSYMIKIY